MTQSSAAQATPLLYPHPADHARLRNVIAGGRRAKTHVIPTSKKGQKMHDRSLPPFGPTPGTGGAVTQVGCVLYVK